MRTPLATTVEHPETDSAGFDAAECDAALLEVLRESTILERTVLSQRLLAVADWADSHPGTDDASILGCDEHPGGEGTPSISAFAAEPLAHALETSTHEAQSLVADTLDLRHRLPRTWDLVHALMVPAWKARRIAAATRHLPLAGAQWVDRQLLGRAASLGPAALGRLVETAMARFDPDALKRREDEERNGWDVSIVHSRRWSGTSELRAKGDTHALLEIQALVQALADDLPEADDTAGMRRFHALGSLVCAGAGESSSIRQVGPRSNLKLYLHADLADVLADAGDAVGTVEGLGPVTLRTIKDWCSRSHVTVVPVLDLAAQSWSPRHDPPPRVVEQVILRDERCVHPRCSTPARACDLDHVVPWRPDEPPPDAEPSTGTTSSNLAPLCRRHHRMKTLGTWTYERLPDGSYWWTGPQGQTALVTPEGTCTLP